MTQYESDLIVIPLGIPAKYIPKVQFEVIILIKKHQMLDMENHHPKFQNSKAIFRQSYFFSINESQNLHVLPTILFFVCFFFFKAHGFHWVTLISSNRW